MWKLHNAQESSLIKVDNSSLKGTQVGLSQVNDLLGAIYG